LPSVLRLQRCGRLQRWGDGREAAPQCVVYEQALQPFAHDASPRATVREGEGRPSVATGKWFGKWLRRCGPLWGSLGPIETQRLSVGVKSIHFFKLFFGIVLSIFMPVFFRNFLQ
jgi:hypothetical protein